ncbi:MAG: hypothetical protein K0S47_3672 [Herbinix sp.]|nr:hypothetical protein [Herbinix sp.]
MNIKEERKRFEENFKLSEAVTLKFYGTEGYDVYNCSLPFWWEGKRYLYGRVERRSEWMRSWVRLFEECGKDEWTLVPDTMIYQLEDPYISKIHKELVLGGTHVKVKSGQLDTYYGYFYKGVNIHDMYYFTTGPDYMKDIRLVELADGRIGVFSRPRNEEIQKLYGCESMVGFAIVDTLKDLTNDVIEKAPYVEGLFGPGEWGGCNQAYLLASGKIGVIGHISYIDQQEGEKVSSYMNMSFVMDPNTRIVEDFKVIGTRNCYPKGPAKMPNLIDCAFTSGIVMRQDGNVDLYSGIGDCQEGRTVIPYPFEGFGAIVEK